MASLSLTGSSGPTKREIALLCAVTLIHAAIITQAVHIPFTLSRGTPEAPRTLSVELHAHSSPPVPTDIDKRVTEQTETPSFATKRSPASPSTFPPRIAASGAEQSELSKHYLRYSPPSAILQYSARSVQKGNEVSGHARIFWQSNERFYSVQGEVSLQDKNAVSFTSEGIIDSRLGVSPNIYMERRHDETPINTRFHWDSKDVSFSTSSKRQTLHGGEQDRASIIWQLIRMGRQNCKLFAPNAQFNMTVVGSRGRGAWSIRVLAQETLVTPIGNISTWHLGLAPKTRSAETVVDLWLAPEQNWYPIKLRYIESNGDTLDLQIQGITLTTES